MGKIGGNLIITGTYFHTIFGKTILSNAAKDKSESFAKIKKLVFNKNVIAASEGSVQFHGMESMPIDTCEFYKCSLKNY